MDGLESRSFILIRKVVLALVSIAGVLPEPKDPLVKAQIGLMGVIGVIQILGALKELLAHEARVRQVL